MQQQKHASSTTYTAAFPRPLVVDCKHAGAKPTAQNREEDPYNKAHYNMNNKKTHKYEENWHKPFHFEEDFAPASLWNLCLLDLCLW